MFELSEFVQAGVGPFLPPSSPPPTRLLSERVPLPAMRNRALPPVGMARHAVPRERAFGYACTLRPSAPER